MPAEAVHRVSGPVSGTDDVPQRCGECRRVVFSRKLLTGGVRTSVGAGGVRVRPSAERTGTVWVGSRLARVQRTDACPAVALQGFLRATHGFPLGTT
ncbi:SsgA family sporulation/cell division regulator [Streptomyces sp. JV185]|uniref:SsgA family sporulation/cell division regulator n=1 Tax=Streptomyces sp. JV185 TaxID=858638 RepID=UPI003FA6F92B